MSAGVGPVARDDATVPWFDGTAEGKFLLRRCLAAGHLSSPRARRCSACDSEELDWAPASGMARLVSWAVVPARHAAGADNAAGVPARHAAGGPDDPGADPPPAVPAIAELDEGPWWWSRVVGADPGSLVEGLRLRIVFDAAEGGEAVPIFAVADVGGGP